MFLFSLSIYLFILFLSSCLLSSEGMRIRTPLSISKSRNPSFSSLGVSSIHFLAASTSSLSNDLDHSMKQLKEKKDEKKEEEIFFSCYSSSELKEIILLKSADILSFYSNILLSRLFISKFPHLLNRFPMLQPLFKLTDPYLSLFIDRLPLVHSTDNAAIPGIFLVEATAFSIRTYANIHKLKKKNQSIEVKESLLTEENKDKLIH